MLVGDSTVARDQMWTVCTGEKKRGGDWGISKCGTRWRCLREVITKLETEGDGGQTWVSRDKQASNRFVGTTVGIYFCLYRIAWNTQPSDPRYGSYGEKKIC